MNSTSPNSQRWPASRWIFFVAAIFVAQAGLVFLLGDRNLIPTRQPVRTAPILIAANHFESPFASEDPTLFALANQHSFSGSAWLRVPPVQHHPTDWIEPPRWLNARVEELGAVFRQLTQTNAQPAQSIAEKIDPEIFLAAIPIPSPGMISRSTWRVAGDLENRPLLSNSDLPAWTRADILANSVVQLLVNTAGEPLSATLLTSSGSKEADDYALVFSKTVRFEPVRLSEQKAKSKIGALTFGNLIFEWQTNPLTSTNTITP